MLTKEENESLTRVGPGTPAGEMLRRYWLPIAFINELKGRPLRRRILGEDLVLFRDEQNRLGTVGASLFASRHFAGIRSSGGWRFALLLPWLALRR